ncbi:GAF domain-containing SpoIIE family protein phosphatase [Paenibacillus sacheonensis]|uniref:SpoIIE family protein phosphatase n=1 Tax=Paenibacillus sacheonensis TaxID=742054 RepID=A0A7X4YLF0_9BACL|nr:GAF domain-containing SpoIIE family protein phosphatase [Paenibacillus sacheonensis]MBM7568299.1 serine phosphatase RsbU (regulator of sigma subunit) [Paenibacillus sacheonensis]NBC68516.1 SpoIIE family protein phosphatase [Paenibacillus sacheonensis]
MAFVISFWVALAVLLLAAGMLRIVRKEQHRTTKLFNIGLQLNATIKRKDLLGIIMETASREMSAEGSSIILVDQKTGELYFEVATGDKTDEVKEIRLKAGEGIAGWVAGSGQSVLIADAANDSRWSNKVALKVKIPTRNMLCVPVRSGGKTLGVLQVINKRGRSAFNKLDLRLLEMIASPTAIALENMLLYEALEQSIENLRVTTAAKERMESELKIARDIQMSFLPGESLRSGKADLHARLIPAREVGGDFYHFMEIGEDKLLICLGDVSDKGMPAALFMSGLMIWIRAKATTGLSPAAILMAINREISTEESTMFATIFLAILDTRTGAITYCDGGHCTPLILSAGGVRELETTKHLPVGIFGDLRYEDNEDTLAEGETLLLYTDGITEAENGRGEWFSMERLREELGFHASRSPIELTESLVNAVARFAEKHPQSDDIAIMALQYAGS